MGERIRVRVLAAVVALSLLALLLTVTPAAAAAPSNDNFGHARAVGHLPAVITGSNAEATSQTDDPDSLCSTKEKTIWYKLTLAHTASLLVDARGSGHATGVSIFVGPSLSMLAEAACSYGSSDPNVGLIGRVTFQAKAGVRYYIRLSAGFEGDDTPGGFIHLSIKRVTRLANDDFTKAQPISSLPFEAKFSNVRTTTVLAEPHTGPCFDLRASAWYTVHATEAMTLRADTLPTHFDTLLAVFEGGPTLGKLRYVACDDDTSAANANAIASSVTWSAGAGKTYWIQVGGYDNETGAMDLRVRRVTPPANDDRANAKVIPNVGVADFDHMSSTRNATLERGETTDPSCTNGDPNQGRYPQSTWYRYTAPNTDPVLFTFTSPAGVYPVLSAYTGATIATQALVACSGSGTLTLTPQAGKTYFLEFAGADGRSGPYSLHAEPAP